jgi:hypothetical protein
MLNNILKYHTPWDSQNPYNPRLNQKQALWSGWKKKTTTFSILISDMLMKGTSPIWVPKKVVSTTKSTHVHVSNESID